mgnify:CR=1 FL=1
MWITIIVSATNFENLFALRCHPAAEPHFQNLSYKARKALDCSIPAKLNWGKYHLPLVNEDERLNMDVGLEPCKVSSGRCARVSYLTHEGKRDVSEDIRLYEQLAKHKPMHASPLEHPAEAVDPMRYKNTDWGNFDPGWLQFRKMHKDECVTSRMV